MSGKRTLISLDLILDLNSYFFSCVRSFLWRNDIYVENDFRTKIELRPVEQICQIVQDYNKDLNIIGLSQIIESNLQSIKPQVFAVDMIKILEEGGASIVFYSYLEESIREKIQKLNESWLKQEVFGEIKDKQFDIVITSILEDIENFQYIDDSKKIYVKNSNFKSESSDVKKGSIKEHKLLEEIDYAGLLSLQQSINIPQQEFRLRLKEKVLGESYQGFQTYKTLEQPIKIQSFIVEGKGRANKDLGIPTANLKIDKQINEKIKNLLNGVYLGSVLKDGVTYAALVFLGYSEYFNDKLKQLEAYIYHEFDSTFYDQELTLEINYFLRPEADFKSFDHLIKTIHCDVYFGSKVAEKQLKLKNDIVCY